MKDLGFIYIWLLLITAGCGAIEFSEIPQYPVTIEPLSLLTLDELNKKYQSENEGQICSTLNEYGFTGYSRILFSNNINPCTYKDVVRIEIRNPDSLILLAKRVVVKNKEYTNVSDIDELEIVELLPLYGCTICEGPDINSVPLEWKITFGAQKIDNIEVMGTEINVFVDAHGVNRIWGNWYDEYYAPELINVGYLQAQQTVIDTSIALKPITGQDSILTVTTEMLGEPFFQIVPYKNKLGMLEIRKTWKIPINYKHKQVTQLWAQIDVVDGTLLQVIPFPNNNEI